MQFPGNLLLITSFLENHTFPHSDRYFLLVILAMQKLFFSASVILLLFFLSCHNKNTSQPVIPNVDTADVESFFPVTDFLLGQLNDIDSLQVTPLKITISGDKKDSVWLKKKDIRPFVAPFLSPVIDSASMQNFFTEKSFMDQTINAITLTYDPKIKLPDSMKLNHWDIYIDPITNKVQRIYMVKEEEINGETVTTQLTWMANKWCSIRTIKQEAKIAPEVKEEILKWDLDD